MGLFFMYLIYRCDCGRVLYSEDYNKTHKCPSCNKVLKTKSRRVLFKTEDKDMARLKVQELQNELYHNTGFTTANNLRK